MAAITEHFTTREIFGDEPPTADELYLARTLCVNTLEPIRGLMKCPIYVTSGARSELQTRELEARGYNPSRASDHSFGRGWFKYGVGAADIVKLIDNQRSAFTEQEFYRIRNYLNIQNEVVFGQIIWYRHKGHIHVSNPRTLVYSEAFLVARGYWKHKRSYIAEV